MKITIRKPGLMSTIQDLGRLNYLSQAVPVSGAMDSLSEQIANKALGNDEGSAVIEFTHGGAAFFSESDILIALSGDGANLNTSNQGLPSDRPIFIPAGTNLYLENNRSGSRSYLAIAGGWDVPEVLGSRSTYLTAKIGGINGRSLMENDQLSNTGKLTHLTHAIFDSLKGETTNYANWSIARSLFLSSNRKIIRVMPGREFNWFDPPSIIDFLSQTYVVGLNSNRMGYNLQGAVMNRRIKKELLSTAVAPGTIQVTNDGNLILLMADCQTTGGYPRIAQAAVVDMPLCAQLKPGDSISFEEISWKEAEKLYIQHKHHLHKLSLALTQKYALT
jgi:antagonist of KipI